MRGLFAFDYKMCMRRPAAAFVPYVPAAPKIGAVLPFDSSVTVAFTPGLSGGLPITSYTATSTPGGHAGSGAGSPVLVAGLTNGTPYTFTVHATNGVGNSLESSASSPATPVSAAPEFSSISIASNGTNLTVTFATLTDVSAGVAGFAYSIGVGVAVDANSSWRDVQGAVANQSLVVPLADLGIAVGNTVNVDVGYSLTNPATVKRYASDYSISVTTITA